MSSTNKTNSLGLNSWVGSDIPQREDFNTDNILIDKAISDHTSNADIHVKKTDKDRWNAPYVIKSYYGNGETSRTIDLGLSFTPAWGIVIGTSVFPSMIDFTNKSKYNYFGIVSRFGSTAGMTFNSDGNLRVVQSSTSVSQADYRCFNESGIAYLVIIFR